MSCRTTCEIYRYCWLETQSFADESKSVWNVLLEQQVYCIVLLGVVLKIFQSPSWVRISSRVCVGESC